MTAIRDLQWLLDEIRRRPRASGPRIVGIDGGGGAGKTTLATNLREAAPSSVQCVHIDDFYWPEREESDEPAEPCWFFDWRRLRDDVLAPLMSGQDASFLPFDWDTRTLGDAEICVEPSGIVVLEGISALRRELRPWIDFGIWVQAPPALRLQRGLERDGADARETWVNYWMAEEARYFAEHRPHRVADLLIRGGDSTAGDDGSSGVQLMDQQAMESALGDDSSSGTHFPFATHLRAATEIDAEFVSSAVADVAPASFTNRYGSYGVMQNEAGDIAVAEVDECLFLPGGGWESGDSAVGALHREAHEELGWQIRVDSLIGTASYSFRARTDRQFYRKVGYFYDTTRVDAASTGSESSHSTIWISPQAAIDSLHELSHRWAVERALARGQKVGR